MIRALFILLAVVSLVLGFVLDNPLLYLAAGALLLLSAIMIVVMAASRRKKAKQAFTAPSQHEELSSFGISDVRPVTKPTRSESNEEGFAVVGEPDAVSAGNGTQAPEQVSRTSSDGAAREADSGPGESKLPEAEVQPSPADKVADVDDAQAKDRFRREILEPCLQSMQNAIGANTVCLLRQDEAALKYHIEAIVSRNAYARTKGYFTTRVPLLTPAIQKKPVVTLRVGEKGIPANNLAYYVETMIAIRHVAVTDVPQRSSSASFFLLADTMEDGGLSDERKHGLFVRFGRLVASILDGGEPVRPGELDAERRPRRDIIADEMDRARSKGIPLALILVYLNEAENIAREGDEGVNEAEAILEGRLRDIAGGRRVEHFGELIYAVFYEGDAAEVEPFVVELQEGLRADSGPLAGEVSIGVAFLKDRHTSPESFRTDANEALREAFETGASTILE